MRDNRSQGSMGISRRLMAGRYHAGNAEGGVVRKTSAAAEARSDPSAAAREAAKRAYVPHSRFPVGAILEDANGRIHAGCNIECVSLGLTVCAERIALARARAAGASSFVRLWIYTPTPSSTFPCGACRDLLARVAGDLAVSYTHLTLP
ncbi:MAG: cytidine deaminase, partial [Candidatus Eisenbacteria bacterium]|nr:cytidine deaminase [Candidatus Eisenbacteria bacterium]